MSTIDFSLHPVLTPSENKLFYLNDVDFNIRLQDISHPQVCHSLVSLLDSGVVYREQQVRDIHNISINGNYSFSFMPEIEGLRGKEQIDIAASMGCKALLLHPYLQQICGSRVEKARKLAIYAAEKGMFICICSAYGSKDIFRYKPLETVVAIAESVDLPVVIVHGGGAKILDAFLIAEAFPHIYLDTSFSLHYWLGSPIEEMYAFAIRSLGVDRWMFGSDAPFRPLSETIEVHTDFCNRHGFNQEEVNQIMYGTASKLLKL